MMVLVIILWVLKKLRVYKAGAKILEKHFTLDKNLSGPDHILSVSPKELNELHKYRLKNANKKLV